MQIFKPLLLHGKFSDKDRTLVYFKKSMSLLDRRSRRTIFVISGIQAFLSVLDLIGVALMGVLAAVSVRGIQSQDLGGRTQSMVELLGLGDFDFQIQVAILAGLATTVLVSKTILSIFFARRILFFLSSKAGSLSADLFEKILLNRYFLVKTYSTQEILHSITDGISTIMVGIIGNSLTFISDFFLLLVILVGLFIVDPGMAISTLIVFGSISFVLYRLLYKRAKNLGSQNALMSIESNERILEALSALREARVRARTSYYLKQIRTQRLGLSRLTAEMSFMPNISKYVMEISVVIGALLVATIQFLSKDATQAVSSLLVFLAAGTRVAPAILRAQQGAVQIKSSIGASVRTFEIMEDFDDLLEVDPTVPDFVNFHENFLPAIRVEGLSFQHTKKSQFSLKNINLTVNPGQVIAFVGPSGSGKTTLIDLILGLLPLDIGRVQISEQAPNDACKKWPGAIAYVPQEVYIVKGTIRENIALGFDTGVADDSHYWRCLEIAQLKHVVITFSEGLDTLVGENGSNLSGGQRQRLGIARALFTSPKLIVLDEATSSLDGQTELEITDAIQELRGRTTVLVIAHRLASVRSADSVVYMQDGQIICSGSFEQVRNLVPDFNKQAQLMGL
jgi:ABC-type multidrug transport system fused ATPase/permease subunit